MKEAYSKPDLEIVEFACDDVITTSDPFDPDENELPVFK